MIADTEQPVDLEIGGMQVVGKIDRIERNAATGGWRVLDYKTRDTGDTPEENHSAVSRSAADAPEFARFTIEGKERVWTDLQLPLYVEALARRGRTPVVPAYFNLPKATGATAVLAWEDYGEEWRAAASRCAEGVVAAVRAGVFWPPAEIPPREDGDYAELFQQGTAASVDPEFARREGTG